MEVLLLVLLKDSDKLSAMEDETLTPLLVTLLYVRVRALPLNSAIPNAEAGALERLLLNEDGITAAVAVVVATGTAELALAV